MGRMERRTKKNELPYFYVDDNKKDNFSDEDADFFEEQPQTTIQESQGRLAEEELYRQSILKRMLHRRNKEFGESKNSYSIAKDIENNPSPEGALRITVMGRDIDLHALEDYLVWHTSPLTIKTILRYGHAKTMEDIRGYTNVLQRRGDGSKMLVMIILAIILMAGGLVFILYGPKLATMFGMG